MSSFTGLWTKSGPFTEFDIITEYVLLSFIKELQLFYYFYSLSTG